MIGWITIRPDTSLFFISLCYIFYNPTSLIRVMVRTASARYILIVFSHYYIAIWYAYILYILNNTYIYSYDILYMICTIIHIVGYKLITYGPSALIFHCHSEPHHLISTVLNILDTCISQAVTKLGLKEFQKFVEKVGVLFQLSEWYLHKVIPLLH